MNRETALEVLIEAKSELARRFGVTRLALFGSVGRGSGGPESDVGVLVEFDGSANSMRCFGVQFYLEDALGPPVDLVTANALRAELRPFIEGELADV